METEASETFWSLVDEFIEDFYSANLMSAALIAEEFFTEFAKQEELPHISHAPKVEFMIHSASQLISNTMNPTALSKSFLKALNSLTKRHESATDNHYRIQNSMQGVYATLLEILDNNQTDMEMVDLWCSVFTWFMQYDVIEIEVNSPRYKYTLSVLENLVSFPIDVDDNVLYYDATYDRRTNIRTKGLYLMYLLGKQTDYETYFALPANCPWNIREVHVATIKWVEEESLDKVVNSLVDILESWRDNKGTHPLLFASALHSLSTIIFHAPTEPKYFQLHKWCYLAMDHNDKRIKYSGIRCCDFFGIHIRDELKSEHFSRIYKIAKQCAHDLIQEKNEEIFYSLFQLMTPYDLAALVDHERTKEFFTLVFDISEMIKQYNGTPYMMDQVYQFINLNIDELVKETKILDSTLSYALDQALLLQLTQEQELFIQLALKVILPLGDLSEKQTLQIKEIITQTLLDEPSDKKLVSLAFNIVGEYAKDRRIITIVDDMGKFIGEQLFSAAFYALKNQTDAADAALFALSEIFQHYIREHKDLLNSFGTTLLRAFAFFVIQSSIRNTQSARFFCRLCCEYPDVMAPAFARTGCYTIGQAVQDELPDQLDEFYSALDIMADELTKCRTDLEYSVEGLEYIIPQTLWQERIVKKLHIVMMINQQRDEE